MTLETTVYDKIERLTGNRQYSLDYQTFQALFPGIIVSQSVINSLPELPANASADSRNIYQGAMRQFFDWYFQGRYRIAARKALDTSSPSLPFHKDKDLEALCEQIKPEENINAVLDTVRSRITSCPEYLKLFSETILSESDRPTASKRSWYDPRRLASKVKEKVVSTMAYQTLVSSISEMYNRAKDKITSCRWYQKVEPYLSLTGRTINHIKNSIMLPCHGIRRYLSFRNQDDCVITSYHKHMIGVRDAIANNTKGQDSKKNIELLACAEHELESYLRPFEELKRDHALQKRLFVKDVSAFMKRFEEFEHAKIMLAALRYQRLKLIHEHQELLLTAPLPAVQMAA